jgi:hypothetical protein
MAEAELKKKKKKENPVPGYKGFLSGLTPNTRIEMAKADERDRIKSFWGGDKTSTYQRDVPMQSDFIAARDMEDSAPGEKVVPYKQSLMGKPDVRNDVNVPRHLWNKSPSVGMADQADLPPIPGGRSPTEIAMAEEQRQESMKAREDAISGLKKRGAEKSADINKQLEGLDKKTKALEKEKTGKYFIDPGSGFALNLDKMKEGNKRREVMDQAALLPAASRASFLYKHGYIDKDDLPEPSALEQIKLKSAEVQLANFALQQQKLQREERDYMSPKEKEQWASYRQALQSGNYYSAMMLAEKVGMPKVEVEKMIELDQKLKIANAKKTGTDKVWQNTFMGETYGSWTKNRTTAFKNAKEYVWDRGDPSLEKPGKRSDALKTYQLYEWREGADGGALAMLNTKTQTADGKPSNAFIDWVQKRASSGGPLDAEGNPTPDLAFAYAYRQLPRGAITETDYDNFLMNVVAMNNLSETYGSMKNVMSRVNLELYNDQKADERILTGQPLPKKEDKKDGEIDKTDKKPPIVVEGTSGEDVWNAAIKKGFPEEYGVDEFVKQLNNVTGKNYSYPNNMPDTFPNFWGTPEEEKALLEKNKNKKKDDNNANQGLISKGLNVGEIENEIKNELPPNTTPQGVTKALEMYIKQGERLFSEVVEEEERKRASTSKRSGGPKPDRRRWTNEKEALDFFRNNLKEFNKLDKEVRYYLIKNNLI